MFIKFNNYLIMSEIVELFKVAMAWPLQFIRSASAAPSTTEVRAAQRFGAELA